MMRPAKMGDDGMRVWTNKTFKVAGIGATLWCGLAAAQLPSDSRRAGGIAVLEVPTETTSASFDGHSVALVTESGKRYAVVGIPITAPVGTLTVKTTSGAQSFTTQPHGYAEQRLTLKDQSRVTPSAEQLARYSREAKEQSDIYHSFSDPQGAGFPSFIKPTSGPYSSPFGFKRFFNGEARAPHAGLDIAAPQGQEAHAPAGGKVVQTGDYFFNGKTVMIDHGQGIISMLCHLSRIDVQGGQRVNQGDVVGLVGATGRATGPHLHWTMSLNNARVDPRLFLPASQR